MIILASDLDGTLLFNDVPGQVKKEDIEAIKKFQNNGNLFGVCTGRPIGDVKIDAIDIDFYVVSSGAVVLDKNRQVISEELIDEDIVFAIYNKYIDQVYVCVHGDGKLYNTKDGRFNLNTTRIDAVEQLKGHHLYGLSIDALDEKRAKEITDEINEQLVTFFDPFQIFDWVFSFIPISDPTGRYKPPNAASALKKKLRDHATRNEIV